MNFLTAFFDELQKLAAKRVVTPENIKFRTEMDLVASRALGEKSTGGNPGNPLDRTGTHSRPLTGRNGVAPQLPPLPPKPPPPTPKASPGSPF